MIKKEKKVSTPKVNVKKEPITILHVEYDKVKGVIDIDYKGTRNTLMYLCTHLPELRIEGLVEEGSMKEAIDLFDTYKTLYKDAMVKIEAKILEAELVKGGLGDLLKKMTEVVKAHSEKKAKSKKKSK